MRIGIDILKGLAPRDGVGVYVAELLHALMRRDDDDEFLLYGLAEPLDLEAFADEFPEADERFVPRPDRRPERDGLDLFHSTAWAVPLDYRGPLLYTVHDLTFLTHAEFHTWDNRFHCMKGSLEAVLHDPALFLSVSQATADSLCEELSVDPERVRVVHHAAAPDFQPRELDGVRSRLLRRFAVEEPYLLSVGTLEPRKNLQRLLEAWVGLPESVRRGLSCILAGGEGWLLDESELPSSPSIRRLGAVDRDGLVDLMNGATLFAYPSLAEGFGLPVIEAMACGTPVLTSNLSSLPEVTAGAARLVDPYDVEALRRALQELIESPAERERLRLAGLERAATFSWERTARETRDVYLEACDLKSRS